jgi:hypothetical protein
MAEQRDDILHVRDFNEIREWASKRTFLDEDSDFSVYIKDDFLLPGPLG